MRWRIILGVSLVANLILLVAWLRAPRSVAAGDNNLPSGTNILSVTNTRPAVIVRRQFFSWQELESRDYPTYIKNLREIGCPEQTIRDIIIADVTQVLREKYQDQLSQFRPNPRWWTNEREPVVETNSQADMWAERNVILTQLLGPDWAVRGAVSSSSTNRYEQLLLATMETNPRLQNLSEENKQAVAAILSSAAGNYDEDTWDAAKEVAAEKERWARLSQILSPEQLEAAKLHFSAHSERLRNELDALPGFTVEPEEFRKIFQATESIDEQLLALAGNDSPAAQRQREKLLADRMEAVRQILTQPRYEQYVRLQDPAYLSAVETLGNVNNSDALALLYAINRQATEEQERILNDETLTEREREIQLKQLELEQMKATAEALGQRPPDTLAPEPTQPPREPMKVHTVLPGEGLERVARLYGIPPDALRAANPNLNFDQLPSGAQINVPLRMVYPLPPPVRATP